MKGTRQIMKEASSLKKIISHLSKIEEGELKEGEEWDEGDKENYERSKLT